MKTLLAFVCVLAACIQWTASNRHRLPQSTTTECPQAQAASDAAGVGAGAWSPQELETQAYNAAVERLKSQLFRVFEKYGVAAGPGPGEPGPGPGPRPGPVDGEQTENETREDADAVLQKIHEVLPSDPKMATTLGDDEEQATLYIPLPNRRCSALESGHCFTLDMRGINFNGEKDGTLNVYVRGLSFTVGSKHQIQVYEESVAMATGNTSSPRLEQFARVFEDVHVNQRKWVKIAVQSARLARWHSKETKLVVRISSPRAETAAIMLDLESVTMRPYLELAPQKIRQRARRSASHAVSQAFLGDCEIRVAEVPSSTLDSRILAPHSLKVRFCTGECPTWTPAEAIRFRFDGTLVTSVSRCCVPSSYANVTILWKEDANKNSIVHLSKAFPTSCRCM